MFIACTLFLDFLFRCSRLEYLKFLLTLSRQGLRDACFPFVRVRGGIGGGQQVAEREGSAGWEAGLGGLQVSSHLFFAR